MELHVLDGYVRGQRITGFTGVQIVQRDLETGGWIVDIPMDEAGGVASEWAEARSWPGLEVSEPGWRFGGFLTSVTMIRDADGVETARFSGKDFQTDLASRLEYPEAADEGQWWVNTTAGTIARTSDAWNVVANHASTSAIPRRQITGLILGDDPVGGEPLGRRVKGAPLLDVIRTLLAGTPWTATLRLVRDPVSGAGAVQFDTFARPVAQMILDAKVGTLGAMSHTREASAATFVIAMGASSGALDPTERFVAVAEVPSVSWRSRYRELFINRPATENLSTLGDEAQSALAAGFEPTSIKIDQAQVDGFGSLIDVGWLADVRIGGATGTARLPVAASTLTFTPRDGWVRTVDVGTEALSGPAALRDQLTRVARQTSNVENELS